MRKIHYIFLVVLSIGAVIVIYSLYQQKSQPPLGVSFSPLFQLLGKPIKSADKAISRVLPIDQMDEKEYGDAIAEEYLARTNILDTNYIYLNKLIKDISVFSKRKFTYKVFTLSTSVANAYALPGGVIFVTDGLLHTMKSEAEIVSILAHEMGHIERGHCFDAIKFQLTLKKIKFATVGQLADFVFFLLLHNSYSKTQENDADQYGYDLVLLTQYDPIEFSEAFKQFQAEYGYTPYKSNIITDYLNTHPPIPMRIEKFEQSAKQWWKEHKGEKRYIGIKNLNHRISMSQQLFIEEWSNNDTVTH